MLLSAGMDSKVKIWDVHDSKKCLRTYMGHAAAVRDIDFQPDGACFVTCSYDRYLKLWDTETGECISAFTNRKLPYCSKLHPDQPHVLMIGCSNKQIVQYDMRSGKQEQVYDQHLGAVNTLTFCEENRRFVTTADDKKMLIWEFGIPVPIKHIAGEMACALFPSPCSPSRSPSLTLTLSARSNAAFDARRHQDAQ